MIGSKMKIGDIVSEALEFGVDWEEAERYDQTQRGVIFQKSKGLFHILWFDTQDLQLSNQSKNNSPLASVI